MTWTWEYYDGAYIVRRIDMTKQVAYIAPRTPANNAAAGGLCEFYDTLEAENAALRGALQEAFEQRRYLEDLGYYIPLTTPIYDLMAALNQRPAETLPPPP